MNNKEAIKLVQGIEEDGRNVTSEHVEALDLAIKAIEEKEADKWNVIHTEADLPNKEGYYLVDCKESVLSIQRLNFSIADHKPYWSGMCKVYAWRSLPKPYESEDNENETSEPI